MTRSDPMRKIPTDRDVCDFDLMQRLLLTKTARKPSLLARIAQAIGRALGLR